MSNEYSFKDDLKALPLSFIKGTIATISAVFQLILIAIKMWWLLSTSYKVIALIIIALSIAFPPLILSLCYLATDSYVGGNYLENTDGSE